MLRSLARLAVNLNLDTFSNLLIENLYTATSTPGRRSTRFQILVYHKVSPDPHPFYAPVDPAYFEQQMRFLSRCYRVMDLEELTQRSLTGSVPARAVAITFDDGYVDNYEYAFPILKKYGLTATIFVATGVTGTANLLWHDRVFDSFRFTSKERARLSLVDLPELSLDSPQARQHSLDITLAKAKTLWGEERSRFVDEIEQALQPSLPSEPPRMLNWNQIREMHRAGISFGSHTVTHPILSLLPAAELTKELRESRRRLGEALETPIHTFAYPNGQSADFNHRTKIALKECGYKCAVTTVRGFNPTFADPYEFKRDLPWDSEIDLFRFKFFLQRHGLN
jgi:peptidoglycan/xylan/chitin deacetylase (PgdA/CDA1 family)